MTRGTIHLILPDKILCSTQFNGDMYLDGHGNNVIKRFEDVASESDYRIMVKKFATENFPNYENIEFFNDDWKESQLPLMCGKAPGAPTYADYTYWKNLSGRNITFIDTNGLKLILETGGVAVFNFCTRYMKVYPQAKEE